jgi:hypothetical protein
MSRSLHIRREIARKRVLQVQQEALVTTAHHWPSIDRLFDDWNEVCNKTIKNMLVCGSCGAVCYGNCLDQKYNFRSIEPPALAPYAYCNLFLLPYIHRDPETYYVCRHYAQKPNRCSILSFMSPSYIRILLKAKPLYVQLLAFIDCRLGISNKFNGFHSGFVQNNSLIDNPMISWNIDTMICSNLSTILAEVYSILETI